VQAPNKNEYTGGMEISVTHLDPGQFYCLARAPNNTAVKRNYLMKANDFLTSFFVADFNFNIAS
jgi:hypothetical protein